MIQISTEIGRQVGLLLDRKGRIEKILVGSPSEIVIPHLGRARAGAGRLRGLRLVHTHLNQELLSTEDLTDLSLVRLDMMAAVWEEKGGAVHKIQMAHVDPAPGADPPWVVLPPENVGREGLDFSRFIEDLEAELASSFGASAKGEEIKAVLAHLSQLSKAEAQERLDELSELARTERIAATDSVIYKGAIHPQTFLGAGRAKELMIRAMAKGADMILFDQELSPAQLKWINGLADLPVMDRTQLILEIFARRAHSTDGKLRVELARLRYELPRVGYREEALSRIRGGIGMRGPGETTAETTRRMIKDRIRNLQSRLDKISRGRDERRKKRKRSGLPQVAIIGYTNAGKSTLLNALTNSDVLVEDKLFATLDPTSRRIRFPRQMELVLSDTVGFIRSLPESLLEAFRSTLEELNDADLLLHLVDLSAPNFKKAIEMVEEVLRQLNLGHIPRKIVFNKVDLVSPVEAANQCRRYDAIGISALEKQGMEGLLRFLPEEVGRIHAFGHAGIYDHPRNSNEPDEE